ncbi:MAG: galactitol-1-phosphate 5-dehydrogenase [Gammaproteobacteria bacterium]|nr:MAG: galactitol-1-phosphate 5-dehydrogenase [Gammaproteobacteria bacterium]
MKALVYTAEKEIQFRDEPAPEPGPGEVVVAVDAVGICGSDMHAYLGHDPRRVPPLILGHEAVGRVVDDATAGPTVLINPLITCGHCDACQGGRANLCETREIIGMYRPGALAERVAVPAKNLLEIPPDMDPAHAALTEPAATALHAVNLAAKVAHRPVSESRALVIGGGSVGLFAAMALRDQGASEIHLAETNPLRRRTVENTGACRVIDPVSEPARDSSFEIVVDAVGGKLSRQAAIAAVRPGGVVMHIGLLDDDGGIDVRRLTLQEICLIGTYTYTAVDLRATVKKLHSGAFGDLGWVEKRSLGDGARAFDDLLHGRSAAPKIVLCP